MELCRLPRLAGAGLLAVLCLTGQFALKASAGTPLASSGSHPTVLPPANEVPRPITLPTVNDLPQSAPASPASKQRTSPADSCAVCEGSEDYWAKVPPIQPFPRQGYFPILPTGPGYYSLADAIHDEYRTGPPRYPYPRFSIIPQPFFDIDWRYLDKPDNTEFDYFDCLKRIRIGENCMLFTTGGDFRVRYNHEENRQLSGLDNTYDLYRLRAYGDLMITNRFRIFAEFISATSPNYHLPPLGIDQNKADFLNLFADVAIGDIGDSPVWVRVGRQELLYGSQRLISPLDWANTRRTFQGVKAFWQSEKLNVDAFCVQPIPVAPNPVGVRNVNEFDSVDNNQLFAGLWSTYKPSKNQAVDAYYLFLDNTNPQADYRFISPTTGRPARTTLTGATTVHTFGSRWVGDCDGWLWDVEGAIQFGGFYDQHLFAGAGTIGGGYHWKDAWSTPMLWLYYDYASGDRNPSLSGTNSTFNQLFPFGHYYFGFADVVARRNIHDISAYFTFWPEKWIQGQLQCHNFILASRQDALYNAAGLPIRQDVTGRAGSFVGTELDLLVNFHLSKHSDILISCSYLFAGEFIANTATTSSGRTDVQALYVQYTYRW